MEKNKENEYNTAIEEESMANENIPKQESLEEESKDINEEELQEISKEEKLEEEIRVLKDDYLRLKADFENYRKRMQDEVLKTKERAISNFVEDLLPSIDNFEMSLKMTNDTQMFIKGVEMIHKNLHSVLENHSISIYEPQVGEEFNVKEHEPILIEHEELPPGSVAGVVSKGYRLKDSIIRPARVHVVEDKSDSNKKE